MRKLFVRASIPALALIIPEVWKNSWEFLRQSAYWHWIQAACVLWILSVLAVWVVERRRAKRSPARPVPAAQVSVVRFEKGAARAPEGFWICNDSESPAFEVQIVPFRIGRYTVKVGRSPIPRLVRSHGEVLLSPVSLEAGNTVTTGATYRALLDWETAQGKEHEGMPVPFSVRWREGSDNAIWHEREFQMQRDVIVGVAVSVLNAH